MFWIYSPFRHVKQHVTWNPMPHWSFQTKRFSLLHLYPPSNNQHWEQNPSQFRSNRTTHTQKKCFWEVLPHFFCKTQRDHWKHTSVQDCTSWSACLRSEPTSFVAVDIARTKSRRVCLAQTTQPKDAIFLIKKRECNILVRQSHCRLQIILGNVLLA